MLNDELQKFNAEVVQVDKTNDLAVLKIFDVKFDGVSAQQKKRLQKNAGFYSLNKTDLDQFLELNLNALNNTDLLAYWDCPGQYDLVDDLKTDLIFTSLRNLEPFWQDQDWFSTILDKNIPFV